MPLDWLRTIPKLSMAQHAAPYLKNPHEATEDHEALAEAIEEFKEGTGLSRTRLSLGFWV